MAGTRVSWEDYQGIQLLISDYAWAYDCRDFVAMSETFVPDGVMHIGGGAYEGRALIAHFVETHVQEQHLDKVMQHHIAHLKVFADGDDFRAYSYWMVPGQMLADRSAFVGALGWYQDVITKTDGRWLFKERRMHDGMPQGLPWDAA